MKNKTINFNLFLVIEDDDHDFYNEILPRMFRALLDRNVLFSIASHDYDGSKHYVLTGTKDDVRAVLETSFPDDDQICDELDYMY